jgi:hypothetical protein
MTVTSRTSDTMRTRTAERLRDRITRKLVGTADRRELAASLRRIAADSCGDGALRTRMTGASSRVKERALSSSYSRGASRTPIRSTLAASP